MWDLFSQRTRKRRINNNGNNNYLCIGFFDSHCRSDIFQNTRPQRTESPQSSQSLIIRQTFNRKGQVHRLPFLVLISLNLSWIYRRFTADSSLLHQSGSSRNCRDKSVWFQGRNVRDFRLLSLCSLQTFSIRLQMYAVQHRS